MKPSILIAPAVFPGVLIRPLRERRIAAAGPDVYENEPAFNPDFLSLSNVVPAPHISSASIRTRLAMASCAADRLVAALTAGQMPSKLPNPAAKAGC
jgi:glyoxylate reductase